MKLDKEMYKLETHEKGNNQPDPGDSQSSVQEKMCHKKHLHAKGQISANTQTSVAPAGTEENKAPNQKTERITQYQSRNK